MASARKPEDCDLLLIDALNKGDLEGAMAQYETDARIVLPSGEVVSGDAAIRDVMRGYLSMKPDFSMDVTAAINGDIALLNSQWEVKGVDSEGNTIFMSGSGSEVVRRQSDGTWKFMIDNPGGQLL